VAVFVQNEEKWKGIEEKEELEITKPARFLKPGRFSGKSFGSYGRLIPNLREGLPSPIGRGLGRGLL
jgi:hypothetical protein